MRARLPAHSLAPPALAVAGMTAVGIALRLVVAHDSVFADELSSYWIVSSNGLGGVVETVHSDAEITPPLSFVAAWLTTRAGLTPELLRAPSLAAGSAAIPLIYLVGRRLAGLRAGLVAAALTTLSPFMIFYSAEARGYALMIALVLLSTLALLVAVEDGRRRWWVAYAVFSCAAVYTHYTSVFVLAAQLLWALWAHPGARRAAILASVAAAVAYLPWLSGLVADFRSPTTRILAALSPFDLDSVVSSLGHWAVGYPFGSVPLVSLPGGIALALLLVGVGAGIVGAAARRRPSQAAPRPRRPSPGLVLIAALALAAPAGEAIVSLVSTDLFGTRNLAASWPGAALAAAALVTAPRRLLLRNAATALVLAGFAIGAATMLNPTYQRPDFDAAAELAERAASPSTPVIDATALTPGPLTGLDVALDRPLRLFRAGVPNERSHPFTVFDPVPEVGEVSRSAAAAASDGRVVVVTPGTTATVGTGASVGSEVVRQLPDGFRRVEATTVPGILPLTVLVFERPDERASR